jgi:hypothetical protein
MRIGRRALSVACVAVIAAVLGLQPLLPGAVAVQARNDRRLPVKEYVDRMKAGWIGQMAGVGWGAPTEFGYQGRIMPENKMPEWTPGMINQFGQDDMYVEMTFLRTLEQYGLNASIRQAGIDFAGSGYGLAHANAAGRDNLRRGIAPPDSGHPKFNAHADDIDYQIEADYAGLIAPGMPNVAIRLGEIFGRLMNYGDGVYGGQFVGGMYAEAFFEDDPVRLVRAGLQCIPRESQYAECIRDVLRWYRENPNDWEKTWQRIEEKYQKNPDYRRFSCDKGSFNIDAKMNGAYIAMGLLYGEGDPDKTIIISTRCGQDSDCNPSNAAGVLFTTMGFSNLPDRFTSALNPEGKFSHTPYNFPTLISVCEKLARDAVKQSGGRIEKNGEGEEVFVIPVRRARPTPLEQCWEPGPITNSRFSEQDMEEIKALRMATAAAWAPQQRANRMAPQKAFEDFKKFAPGWEMKDCGKDMNPGIYADFGGKKSVYLTHPLGEFIGCVLSRTVAVASGKKTTLRLVVGHHPDGDWVLIIKVDGKEILKKTIGKETARDGWIEISQDLSEYAGKTIGLELVNEPNGWMCEAGYWAEISLISE